MDPLTEIVEKRIQDAIDRGDFERLPGAGQPLHLEGDPLVPEELRVAYRFAARAEKCGIPATGSSGSSGDRLR